MILLLLLNNYKSEAISELLYLSSWKTLVSLKGFECFCFFFISLISH